ncbi:MAG: c-type cytochrome [Alphaproteobacteria bacterium]|nr:c-type cytochrome [Alphaproteobacteria bacterium]
MAQFKAQAATAAIAVLLTGLVPAVLFGTAGSAVAAGGAGEDACDPFPKVVWWENLTHQSVEELVVRRHGGDWQAYIRGWEKNLTKLISIRAKRSRAVIRSQTDKGKRKVLGGKELDAYIDNVAARLAVLRCLADQADAKTKEAGRPSEGQAGTLRQQSADAGKRLAQKLGCNNCHGEGGFSTHRRYPDLAGQSALYLIRQLKEFRTGSPKAGETLGTGRRHSQTMTPRAENLSEDDVWNLTAHFTSLDACPDDEGHPPLRRRPDIAARCVECHGVDGSGVFPEVPNLAGQKKTYLLEQLKTFRQAGKDQAAKRTPSTRYHYFMSVLAKNMNDRDLGRLADYFSKAGCGS